jgi:hypothetical protein
LVTFHEPSRQPSAEVVVVAGAGGAEPVGADGGETEGGGVDAGDVEGGDPESVGAVAVADGAVVVSEGTGADEAAVVVGTEADDVGAVASPPVVWPQIAPTMSPVTAAIARATATIAPAGIEPRASSRDGITASA